MFIALGPMKRNNMYPHDGVVVRPSRRSRPALTPLCCGPALHKGNERKITARPFLTVEFFFLVFISHLAEILAHSMRIALDDTDG